MSEEFKKMIEDAKKRNVNEPDILKVLEDMEADISEESRIKGTMITLNHLRGADEKN